MPVNILKNIKVQCVHPDKFYPVNITKGEWYNVIGVNSWNYVKEDKEKGTKKTDTTIKFLIINDEMKVTSVAMHNCKVVDLESRDNTGDKEKD